jgi:fluoroquinolone resistance protein
MPTDKPQQFINETLTDADFNGAELAGATFETCSLPRACFRGADLRGAHFDGCTFYTPDEPGAQFTFANLREAHFQRCDLTTAEFNGIKGYGLVIEDCQMQGADFSSADFRLPVGNTDLAACTIRGCNFSYGDLSNCFLKGATIVDTRMIELMAQNAILDEACFVFRALTCAVRRSTIWTLERWTLPGCR